MSEFGSFKPLATQTPFLQTRPRAGKISKADQRIEEKRRMLK